MTAIRIGSRRDGRLTEAEWQWVRGFAVGAVLTFMFTMLTIGFFIKWGWV